MVTTHSYILVSILPDFLCAFYKHVDVHTQNYCCLRFTQVDSYLRFHWYLFFFQLKNVFWTSFLKRSPLPTLHGIPWQRCTTTEFPLPYCWTFMLLLILPARAICDNILLRASWSTCASNSLHQRKVESQRQWAVFFSYATLSLSV